MLSPTRQHGLYYLVRRVVFSLSSEFLQTGSVYVKEGGKQEFEIERRTQRHRGKKYIKVYGYICRFNVTFIIRSRQDALSDRSGRTKIGFLLTLTQDLENLIWKWENSYCDRKSIKSGWNSVTMTGFNSLPHHLCSIFPVFKCIGQMFLFFIYFLINPNL